jgi:integrase
VAYAQLSMARRLTGQVLVLKRKHDRVYALRFRAYGRRRYVTLGTRTEGWTRPKAEQELSNVLADVRRGIWRPPSPADAFPSGADVSFHEFASDWLHALRDEGLAASTLADYSWQLSNHLLPFFAEHRLPEITIAEVDRYRQHKVREEGLNPTSINKTITRLGQILEVAVERELIARNPARGRRRRLKQRKPVRTWLDRAEQIEALLEAAAELDREARVDRRATSRRAVLATLALGGLRIGEALALQWRDVDLAAGRLRVRAAKTNAGVRYVDLLPPLQEDLALHKASAPFGGPEEFVFPTESGRRQNASNVRNRVLAMSIARADEKLTASGAAPLPEGLTPHSLRRTFISVLLALGEEVPYVMRQVGHSDPKVTLSIYAQLMHRGEGERERLRALIQGGEWALMGTGADSGAFEAGDEPSAAAAEPRSDAGESEDGRGWFRTSDLSRVKRALSH